MMVESSASNLAQTRASMNAPMKVSTQISPPSTTYSAKTRIRIEILKTAVGLPFAVKERLVEFICVTKHIFL